VHAQVTGKVTDSVNAPMPYAAIGLLRAKDSSVIRGVLSNDSGVYKFNNVKTGKYLIRITSTGYATQFSAPFTADSTSPVTLPNMQLKVSGRTLDGVKVVVDKPFMQRQADKIVFNVENSVITTGKNVLEMLNDLPGVSSDDNGNISVMHKSGVLVLVDGRPLHMDVTNFLKSIDASQVEKIEVISNPSAKYEASGKAVINIILKRDKNLGLNGQLNTIYKQSYYPGGNEVFNLDYRTKKWNFFASGNFNLFHNETTNNTTKTFAGPPAEVFDEADPANYQGHTLFGNAGVDFTPDKKQTLSFSFGGFGMDDNITTADFTKIFGSSPTNYDSAVSSPIVRNLNLIEEFNNLSYKLKLDTNGQEISVNATYGIYSKTDYQQNPFYYYDQWGDYLHPMLNAYSEQPAISKTFNGQADYSQPIGKKIKIDAGVFASHMHQDNNAEFYDGVLGSGIPDTTKSNHFIFTEQVLAGYVTYTQNINKHFDFQVGVRAENTMDNGTQLVHDTSFTRNYTNLFPSGTFNWNINDNYSLSLSYSRRIDRPDFGDMNPFVHVIDPYNYTMGNILLLPMLSDNYEFDGSILGGFISLSLIRVNVNNYLTNAYVQNNLTHITYNMPINLGYSYGNIGNATITIPAGSWLRSENTFTVFNAHSTGTFQGQNYGYQNTAFSFNTLNIFTFKNGWSAEASFNYTGKNLEGLTLTQPISDFNAGISKRLFHDQLTIKVSGSDIFMGQVETTTSLTPGVNIVNTYYGDNRKFRLSVMWKFGKSQYHRQQNQQANPFGGKGTKT
jgi:hypothetical protein